MSLAINLMAISLLNCGNSARVRQLPSCLLQLQTHVKDQGLWKTQGRHVGVRHITQVGIQPDAWTRGSRPQREREREKKRRTDRRTDGACV